MDFDGARAHPTAPPDPEGRAPIDTSVEALMARMSEGDAAAVFLLAEHHGNRIAGAVRRQLRTCGVERIAREDLDALVIDACIALLDVAPAWNPSGALPWTWAQGRVFQVVRSWVGVHADALDERGSFADPADDAPVAAVADEDVASTFARLVDELPVVSLLAEACEAARIEEPTLFCLLEYRIQKDHGDPSPAHTLAPRYGLTPEALRQRVSRSTRRLRAVVGADDRFAPLTDLVLVA